MADTEVKDPWAADPSSTEAQGGVDGPTPSVAPEPPPAADKTAEEPTKPAKKVAAAPAKKAAAPAPAPAPEVPAAAPKGRLGASLADQVTYVTALYWGPEGTGKTTDALRMTNLCVGQDAHKRVLLIDAEAGAKKQALVQRGVDASKIDVWPTPADGGPSALTFEGMFDLAVDLRAQADQYIGWIWDSGSEITKRLLDQVTSDARIKDERLGKQRGRFQVNLEDHGVASSMLRELLRMFRDLPMHGAITALERRDIDNDTGKVKYGPAMSPAMANDAAGLVDVVLFKEVTQLGEDQIRTGHSVPTKIRRAKDRFGVLPAKLADPYFDRLVGYVHGELDRDNDPVQAHVRELAQNLAAAATAEEKK